MFPIIWATFVKNCHQDFSKIFQSGHTAVLRHHLFLFADAAGEADGKL